MRHKLHPIISSPQRWLKLDGVCVYVCVHGCMCVWATTRVHTCMSVRMCLDCVYMCVWIFHQMRNELSGPPPPLPRHILITSGLWYMDRLLGVKHIISLWKQDPGEIHQPASWLVWDSLNHVWASSLPITIYPPAHHLNATLSSLEKCIWLVSPDIHLFWLLSLRQIPQNIVTS